MKSTHAQLLNVEQAEEAIPQELGIRRSSLFMYDRLVFVEGPSDEQIFRTFASTLGFNLEHECWSCYYRRRKELYSLC